MNYKIIIPARYGSSRLPGKPLLEINGKPMIWHVYQRAIETNIGAENIVIATDDERIFKVAEDFGAQVVMTREDHESGTDRLAEVASSLNWADDEVVVNLQGDEPLIPPAMIELTASLLVDNSGAGMATLACKIGDEAEILDPNCVKLVCDENSRAMYFSRAAIPFARDGIDKNLLISANNPWLRHIGMYAYRVNTLKVLSELAPVLIEQLEKLEQLRALYHGITIQVACIDEAPGHGIDTAEDLQRVRNLLA